MKNILFFSLIVLLTWSCNVSQHATNLTADKIKILDSTDYEITIIDPEFDTWYLMNFSQGKDYSNNYYHYQNRVAVSNWNDYFTRGRYQQAINCQIFYDVSVDYGIEVNRKLFWYFTYIEENYRIRLLR
jgi:hypothetical protein